MELDQTEKQQVNFIVGSLWSIYASAYFARGYDTLGESEWVRFEQMMCRQFTSAAAHEGFWCGVLLNQLSPEFRTLVEQTCV